MAKSKYYSYRNAQSILKGKGLLSEIKEIIESTATLTHDSIQKSFLRKGWKVERLFENRRYDCDAYKDRVVVEIEAVDKERTIDYFHRIFFRFLAWRDEKKMDAGVLVTGTKRTSEFSSGAFSAMIDDLETFKSTLTAPIYLIGLG